MLLVLTFKTLHNLIFTYISGVISCSSPTHAVHSSQVTAPFVCVMHSLLCALNPVLGTVSHFLPFLLQTCLFQEYFLPCFLCQSIFLTLLSLDCSAVVCLLFYLSVLNCKLLRAQTFFIKHHVNLGRNMLLLIIHDCDTTSKIINSSG